MLKITLHDSAREFRLKLEGRLSGPWVKELEQCWKTASSTTQDRKTVVDLGEVDFVDPAGETLLAQPARPGRRTGGRHAADLRRAAGDLPRAGLWYGGKSRLDVLMPSTAPLRPDPTRARYETLLEVAESIALHRQLSTLFADLSRLLKPLVPFDFISLTLIDPKERVVRLHVLETDEPVHGSRPRALPSNRLPPSPRSRPGALITSRTPPRKRASPSSATCCAPTGFNPPASCRCSPRSGNSAGSTSAR
jgi:ABC-type transporter Mla MlaB component